MTEPKPTHHRWVSALLSLLLPGAGIYLAGNRKAGLRWFFGLTGLWLVRRIIAPLPTIPGITASMLLLFSTPLVCCWLLVNSYRPIPTIKLRGWIILVLITLTYWASKSIGGNLLAHPFKIPAASMEPTLQPGDSILVQPYAYWFNSPTRGDVVVFSTDDADITLLPKAQFYVKRIAGLPGEKLEIKDGKILINDLPIEMPKQLTGTNFTLPSQIKSYLSGYSIIVPTNSYFIVGDNPTNSLDSRFYGPIPAHCLRGKATKIWMPFERSGNIQ